MPGISGRGVNVKTLSCSGNQNNMKANVDDFILSQNIECSYLSRNTGQRDYQNVYCEKNKNETKAFSQKIGSGKSKVSQYDRNMYRNWAKRLPRVRGLTFDSCQIRWISYWRNEQGKQVQKHFPVSKHGFHEARRLALNFINNKLSREQKFENIDKNKVTTSNNQTAKNSCVTRDISQSLYLLSQPLPVFVLPEKASANEDYNDTDNYQNLCKSSLLHSLDKTVYKFKDENVSLTRATTVSTCAFADNGAMSTPSPYNTRKSSINPEFEKFTKQKLSEDHFDALEDKIDGSFRQNSRRTNCIEGEKDYTEEAKKLPKVRGVHFDSRQQRWCAYGGRKKECFSVYRYGFETARQLALQSRKKTLSKNIKEETNSNIFDLEYLSAENIPDILGEQGLLSPGLEDKKQINNERDTWECTPENCTNTENNGNFCKISKMLGTQENNNDIYYEQDEKQNDFLKSSEGENADSMNYIFFNAAAYTQQAANMPKVPNVYWHKHKLCWYWRRKGAGYGSSKCFSARMYGFLEARRLAIQYGEEQGFDKIRKDLTNRNAKGSIIMCQDEKNNALMDRCDTTDTKKDSATKCDTNPDDEKHFCLEPSNSSSDVFNNSNFYKLCFRMLIADLCESLRQLSAKKGSSDSKIDIYEQHFCNIAESFSEKELKPYIEFFNVCVGRSQIPRELPETLQKSIFNKLLAKFQYDTEIYSTVDSNKSKKRQNVTGYCGSSILNTFESESQDENCTRSYLKLLCTYNNPNDYCEMHNNNSMLSEKEENECISSISYVTNQNESGQFESNRKQRRTSNLHKNFEMLDDNNQCTTN